MINTNMKNNIKHKINAILLEEFAFNNHTDPFKIVANFAVWCQEVKPLVQTLDANYKSLKAQKQAEIAAYRNQKADEQGDQIASSIPKIGKTIGDASKIITSRIPQEGEPEAFDFYKLLSPEERIIEGPEGINVFFCSPEEEEQLCGRSGDLVFKGFNCFSGATSSITYANTPSAFLNVLATNRFGVLFHEYFHGWQHTGDDSDKIKHHERYQEIENVIYSSLAKLATNLLKMSPGKQAAAALKRSGFRNDYTHFINTFMPAKMEQWWNYAGTEIYRGADWPRASKSLKMLFAYFRAYYQGDYSEDMSFPDNYLKDSDDDREYGMR